MPADAPMPPHPTIATFTLGPFATNCYVVSFPGSNSCWIVDASFGPEPITDHIRENALTPELLILTHAHADHIAGVEDLREAFSGLPVALHRAEAEFLANPVLNLSAGFPPSIRCGPAERLLDGNETLTLASEPFRILHTPGHSPGGITIAHDPSGTALVGDTLFHDSVGRSDFPTSNPADLIRSIRTVLYKLPPETTIYPGHGPRTTIAREMQRNPFVPATGPTAFE
ncbi:MAG: MBL fold metallo-hydrolase [Phycisphaerales bacterium]